MMCQEGIIKNNLHKPSFTKIFLIARFPRSLDPQCNPYHLESATQRWRRGPKWLIKSHSDATRASWKIPLMSVVSNVSTGRTTRGSSHHRLITGDEEQLRVVVSRKHLSSRLSKTAFCVAGRGASQWEKELNKAESQMIRFPERQQLNGDNTCLSTSWMSPYFLKKISAGRKSPFRTEYSSDSSLRKSSGPNTK